ncbi:diaminopimelate decarboxylase family protein [Vacuolonema iberomarrocanum]|uniref:diaminopimelate decarboxylase family protein n=1 Tax=Vacuolonema iberomarrocanum TaxID=3454632 RepID=UPI0019F94F48|nr:decarboxylase [filamentous cyanobacterium LEGE 07170]
MISETIRPAPSHESSFETSLKHDLEHLPIQRSHAESLATTWGTPLYVYQGDRLQHTIQHITQSVPYPRTQFHFASVTNGNVNLLQRFQQAGWGLHANTPGDIFLGLHAGFDPAQIVYSGSNLNRADIVQVLDWGVTTLNLDSVAQVRQLGEVWAERPEAPALRLGLRLNQPEITGDSRIGVHPSEFADAVAIAQSFGLQITGLHFYRGTGTNATQAFTQVMEQVIATAQNLPDWRYLDFGGGFGYPYRKGGAAFDWPQFGQALSTQLEQLPRPIELMIEPGRAAIAGSAFLLTRVVSVKWQEDRQIIGVDTTIANLSVPSVHGGYREIVSWDCPEQPRYTTDVCGNTTYSRDYLGRSLSLPALKEGDLLAILDVGAYGYAMSSHFLHRPRPAEVLLEGDRPRLIRQREDYGVLLNHQVLNE